MVGQCLWGPDQWQDLLNAQSSQVVSSKRSIRCHKVSNCLFRIIYILTDVMFCLIHKSSQAMCILCNTLFCETFCCQAMVEENPRAPVLGGEGKGVVSRSCFWCQQKFPIKKKSQITPTPSPLKVHFVKTFTRSMDGTFFRGKSRHVSHVKPSEGWLGGLWVSPWWPCRVECHRGCFLWCFQAARTCGFSSLHKVCVCVCVSLVKEPINSLKNIYDVSLWWCVVSTCGDKSRLSCKFPLSIFSQLWYFACEANQTSIGGLSGCLWANPPEIFAFLIARYLTFYHEETGAERSLDRNFWRWFLCASLGLLPHVREMKYCWWFRIPKQPPGMYKTLVNSGW